LIWIDEAFAGFRPEWLILYAKTDFYVYGFLFKRKAGAD
jgi:hypothetical protein